jgi:hypothetical protein
MIGWLDTSIKLPPLRKGKHDSSDDGLCFMEMVAFMERLPHSDKPECTCPIIANFMIGLNDYFPSDNKRNLLLPYLPQVVGTVSPEHEQERTEYLAWAAITIFAPIALRAAGMFAGAEILANFDKRLGLANETWQAINGDDRAAHIIVDPRPNADWIEYAATPRKNMAPPPRYRSPIHMPRWASRITLEITQICVERLQNMTVGDCIAEGVGRYDPDHAFMNLWESIYGPGSWSANPWVWAITFRAIAACA